MVQHNQQGGAAKSRAIRFSRHLLSNKRLTCGDTPRRRCSRRGNGALAWAFVLLLLFVGLVPARAAAQKLPAGCPPKAQRGDVVDVLHGVRVPDPYRWLENQESPQTRAWITAQDRCTSGALDSLPDRKAISDRLAALMHTESVDVPLIRGGRLFYTKRAPDEDLSLLYTREGVNGREEILVDPRPLSPDHSTSVSLLGASDDGR